jgi:hypothetical protein
MMRILLSIGMNRSILIIWLIERRYLWPMRLLQTIAFREIDFHLAIVLWVMRRDMFFL